MANMSSKRPDPPSYSQFACVGTGFSGIGLGATLKRWYDIGDIRFFERHAKLGGTWYINQYPGTSQWTQWLRIFQFLFLISGFRVRLRHSQRFVQLLL